MFSLWHIHEYICFHHNKSFLCRQQFKTTHTHRSWGKIKKKISLYRVLIGVSSFILRFDKLIILWCKNIHVVICLTFSPIFWNFWITLQSVSWNFPLLLDSNIIGRCALDIGGITCDRGLLCLNSLQSICKTRKTFLILWKNKALLGGLWFLTTDFWILDESYSSQARFSADEILTFEWDTQNFIYNKYFEILKALFIINIPSYLFV
jgi:hypothetical protein